MKKLSLFTAMILFLMVSCSKEELPNEQKVSKSEFKSWEPFSASGQFKSKASTAECEGFMGARTAGSGQSVSIGSFTVSGQYCYGTCHDEEPISFSISNPTLSLEDSNGDVLHITYSEQCYDLMGENNGEILLVYKGIYTIVGGTGHYTKAEGTGSLTITRSLGGSNILGGISEFVMSGTIFYPWATNTEGDPDSK